MKSSFFSTDLSARMIGTRHECACCGRIARILGIYDEGPGETGYIYKFESEPETRWISTKAAAIRFHRVGDEPNDVLRFLKASQR
jgi:hypothetical protein